MPKSKRDKKISLTQTKKKGLELKEKLVDEIRSCVDKHARIFVFSVENMRNSLLKDVRQEWRHSRFFFGKNKVMGLALGQGPEDEYRDKLHCVTRRLQGQVGLLFTNSTKDEVLKWFDTYSEPDFARSGNEATQRVVIEEGPLPSFSHSMEPQLRQLGLPTVLKKGVVNLTTKFKVCDEGKTLTPDQCRLLKLFGHKMAAFQISVEGVWSNDGTYTVLKHDRPDQHIVNKVKLKARKKAAKEEEESDDEEEDDDDDDQGFEATLDSDGDSDNDGAMGGEDDEESD